MTIPAPLLAVLPPYAVVREHPTVPGLYLLTRAFRFQAENPRAGQQVLEYPTETRLVDGQGNDLGQADVASPWVRREVSPELLAQTVTVTTPDGPVTIPLAVVHLAIAASFSTWWAEDRAAEAAAALAAATPASDSE